MLLGCYIDTNTMNEEGQPIKKSMNVLKFAVLGFMLNSVSGQVAAQLPDHFTSEGTELVGCTEARVVRMREALVIFESIMNDSVFRKDLLSQTFVYDVPNDPNGDLTSRQAVERLFRGRENYKSDDDNTANIHWTVYTARKERPPGEWAVIGYTTPQEAMIYTYAWFFDGEENLVDLVGHIAHEWSHKVGFDHCCQPHTGGERTLPYLSGDLVRTYAANITGGPTLTSAHENLTMCATYAERSYLQKNMVHHDCECRCCD
jgi:hypothetical protein